MFFKKYKLPWANLTLEETAFSASSQRSLCNGKQKAATVHNATAQLLDPSHRSLTLNDSAC